MALSLALQLHFSKISQKTQTHGQKITNMID